MPWGPSHSSQTKTLVSGRCANIICIDRVYLVGIDLKSAVVMLEGCISPTLSGDAKVPERRIAQTMRMERNNMFISLVGLLQLNGCLDDRRADEEAIVRVGPCIYRRAASSAALMA